MTFSLAAQTLVFLEAILLGTASGLWYDLWRALRRATRAGPFGTALADFTFWLTALGALFYFAVTEAAAQMRSYVLLGEALGAALYFLCFSPVLLPLVTSLLHAVALVVILPLRFGRQISIFADQKIARAPVVTQIIKKIKKKLPFLKSSG